MNFGKFLPITQYWNNKIPNKHYRFLKPHTLEIKVPISTKYFLNQC